MTAKERDAAERAWYEARMSWVRNLLQGGMWRCPVCRDALRLTAAEEAVKVNVRCCGLNDADGDIKKAHWPTRMERVGDIVLGDEDCGKMEGRRNGR